MNKKTTGKTVSHGKLLYDLYLHVGGTQKEFAKSIKHELSWFTWAAKQETLTPKTLAEVNQKYNLPIEYWEGKYKLPSKHSVVKEEKAEYKTKYEELSEKFQKQRDEYLEQSKELAEAYRKIAEMTETLRENMIKNNE